MIPGLKLDPTNDAVLKGFAAAVKGSAEAKTSLLVTFPEYGVKNVESSGSFTSTVSGALLPNEREHFLHQLIKEKEKFVEVQEKLLQAKDKLIIANNKVMSFLEADLLAARHKLHCRGVLERFELRVCLESVSTLMVILVERIYGLICCEATNK